MFASSVFIRDYSSYTSIPESNDGKRIKPQQEELCAHTHHVGCCHFASPHIISSALKYFIARNRPHKVEHLTRQLEKMLTIVRKTREHVLLSAIQICKELHENQQLDELHDAIRSHFEEYIDRFEQNALHHEAQSLKVHLASINQKIDSRADVFNAAELIKEFTKHLHGEAQRVKAKNQVYQYKLSPILHKEELPGTIKRYSDVPSGDPEVDAVYDICEEVTRYTEEVEGFYPDKFFKRPRITTVGAAIDNAYYNSSIDQIIVGKGKVLFKNLATTGPANEQVFNHEMQHRISQPFYGINLPLQRRGFDYTSQSGNRYGIGFEDGAFVEAIADIKVITKAVETLGINGPTKDDIRPCLRIAENIWQMGTYEDALRDGYDGIGYTSSKVVKYVGAPVEPHFIQYEDTHGPHGEIYNRCVQAGLIEGNVNQIDPHHNSMLYIKIFTNQLLSLGISARHIKKIWDNTYKNTGFHTHGLTFYGNMLKTAKSMQHEEIFGSVDLDEQIRRSFAKQNFPNIP